MLEYFMPHVIYNPTKIDKYECDPQTKAMSSAGTLIDAYGPTFQQDLLQELYITQFLCDRVKSSPSGDVEQELHVVIGRLETETSVVTSACNAITIVAKSCALFYGTDLRSVNIPDTSLPHGQFDFALLQGANLTSGILSRS